MLFFLSCEEDNIQNGTLDPTSTIEALNEYSTMNRIFQDIGNNNGDAILYAENSNGYTARIERTKNDPTVTVEPMDLNTFPKTITIDFKDGTLCKDGITRKGLISIKSTNWYGVEGSEHTATFSDYYHEDFKVEGTHHVKNLGKNNEGYLKYGVTITDGKVTTPNEDTILYKENSFRTWISGDDTPLNIWDDEYLLEGTQSGTSSKNTDYTLTIEDPLHFVLLPRSLKSGILDLEVGNVKDVKLNFGNSTITILGVTYSYGDK